MKKTTLYILLMLMFFSNCVYAAFDVEGNNASYDSNTGILTISDSKFKNSDYTANLSKIKLGNISITGSYEFNSGILKVYVKNKNAINEQGFDENKTVTNGLYMDRGAIIHTYRPPNSINVVLDSPSNIRSLNVNVKGLKPKIVVDNFFTNISSLSSSGGNITLSITGDNLDKGIFKVRENNNSKIYNINTTKASGYLNIKIPENNTGSNIIYDFSLYINDVETDKKVNITVSPLKKDESNDQPSSQEPSKKPIEQGISNKPITKEPDTNSTINNENNIKDELEDNISSNVIDNIETVPQEEKQDNKTTIEKGMFDKNIIYVILIILVFISIIVLILIKIIKKNKNKSL